MVEHARGCCKKLIAAARYALGERDAFAVDADVAEALAGFGAVAAASDARRRPVDTGVSLFEENVEAFSIFQRLSTQWRVVSLGFSGFVYQGFDYLGLEAVLRLMGVASERYADLFERLQIMESAGSDYLNSRLQ